MRIPIQAAAALKDSNGEVYFLTTIWVEGDLIKIRGDKVPRRGQRCELKMELAGMPASVYAEVQIGRSGREDGVDLFTICRIVQIGDTDRERLDTWLDDRSVGGTSRFSHTASWVRLRSASTQRSDSRSTAPRSSDSSRGSRSLSVAEDPWGLSTERSSQLRPGRGSRAIREALRRSRPPRREPPAEPGRSALPDDSDPSIAYDAEAGRIQVRWSTIEAFRRDWDQLRRGRLELDLPHPGKRSLLLRLHLPDGQALAIHAQLRASGDRTLCHFRISLPLRQKMKRVAQP